jgi:flagellar basal-body rod protein FlgC
MPGMFGAIGTASNGLHVYRKWLDAVSDNIANMNTVRSTDQEAFKTRYVEASSIDEGDGDGIGSGARISGVKFGSAEGRLVHEPNNPLADKDGMVRYPDVDLSEQMSNMILAQRGYQANLAVIDRAKAAYEAALTLGK